MDLPTFDTPVAPPDGIVLSAEAAGGPGPRWVVARAEDELLVRYEFLGESEQGLRADMFDPPAGIFLVARDARRPGADPVGGVGLRLTTTTTASASATAGEVKRLWVDPAWRGRGLARALMGALEAAALGFGLTDLELGTGNRQPEAVALYAATGWERRLTDDAGHTLPEWHIRFTKRLP